MRPEFKDHFSTHAAAYATHRPTYPSALVDYLADLAPADGLALDCACGNGQLTALLANRFQRVIGTDASAEQIGNAVSHPRVEYRVALADDSGLPQESADLITVAQAAHWLDLETFYAEARRVARPGAPLALITYGVMEIDGDAGSLVRDFYDESRELCGPPERKHTADGYRNLPFPFADVKAPPFNIEAMWSLTQAIGYIETWSVVREMEKRFDLHTLEKLRADLAAAWGDADTRFCRWPIVMRLAIL
jgi:SAM-dependent methyltransferase